MRQLLASIVEYNTRKKGCGCLYAMFQDTFLQQYAISLFPIFRVFCACLLLRYISKNCANYSFPKIVLFSGIKITMYMPWRRTAKQPPVWIRPFGVSTVADFLADLQAQKSHYYALSFKPTASIWVHYLLYYYTVDSTVCIVYQGRRVPAPLHIFFFSPAHHHRAVCPPPPPAAGSFAAHRRTPPFFKVSSAWNSDVKRNITRRFDGKNTKKVILYSYWRDRDL